MSEQKLWEPGDFGKQEIASMSLENKCIRKELFFILKEMQNYYARYTLLKKRDRNTTINEKLELLHKIRGMKIAYDVIMRSGVPNGIEGYTPDEFHQSLEWQALLY